MLWVKGRPFLLNLEQILLVAYSDDCTVLDVGGLIIPNNALDFLLFLRLNAKYVLQAQFIT